MTDTEKQPINIEQQIGIKSTSMKLGFRTLWKIGLLFGVISFILSLMNPLGIMYLLLIKPYPITIVSSPIGFLIYPEYLTPIFVSLGIIFVSFAGLKSSEKKIESEAK